MAVVAETEYKKHYLSCNELLPQPQALQSDPHTLKTGRHPLREPLDISYAMLVACRA